MGRVAVVVLPPAAVPAEMSLRSSRTDGSGSGCCGLGCPSSKNDLVPYLISSLYASMTGAQSQWPLYRLMNSVNTDSSDTGTTFGWPSNEQLAVLSGPPLGRAAKPLNKIFLAVERRAYADKRVSTSPVDFQFR